MGPESIRIARIADHSFLAAPITPASIVVDLGVNMGAFAMAMIEAYGCAVVGAEPVPQLFAALPAVDGLAVERLAITADGGPTTLYLNQATCATIHEGLSQSDAPSVEVEGITLAGLLDRHLLERVPLVKVDIEGAEIAMIESATLATLKRVDQFTIEFHDFLDPGLAGAVRRARQRLRSAGFVDFKLSRDNSDVLFVNRSRIPFGAVQRTAAAVTHKYPRGIARKLDRRVRSLAGRGVGHVD
jgi:FkbM family methyltransferase